MRFPLAGLAAASLLATSVALAAPASAPASAPAAAAPQPATATNTATAATADTGALAPVLDTLVIGSPLPALPDCADHRTPDGRDVTAFCVELRGDGVMRQVGVPRDKRPAFMDGPKLLALVDGNALVGVMLPTDGIRSQDAAVRALSTRFGKPFRQEQVDMKDKAGKPVKSVHAGWMQRPLTVELYAIPEDPNEGTIELLLPQARALMANRDAEVEKSLAPPASGAAAKKPEKTEKSDKKAPAKPVNPGSW
ncbi:hypothetical protein SAMN05216345_11341 [Cupriavidus sp. YR651]|uniref:hypothetical protein n=1 Tax=Cupriavidus sp. YR651 TaxID=1855315 RepID=UPI000882DDE0|nr:hypothetical protein [Cupriavidus sp. YR651]SDD66547.1 hypothetical protein SAMN05216345_11341 [Cupriavidus sp. YR651]